MVDAGLKLVSLEVTDQEKHPARDVRGRGDGRGDVDPRRLTSGSRPRQPGAARRALRSRRSSRRRPPICRRSSRRRPTRSGRSCSKGASTRPGSCCRCAGRDTSAARERSTSRSRRRWRRRSRASRTRRCRTTSRTSWACRRGKTSRRRSICSRCSPAARRPTSRATRAETPGLGAADEVTLSQLQPLTHEAAGVLLGKPGLGRRLRPGSSIRTLAPGQRVFHMVVGRRPVTVVGPLGRRACPPAGARQRDPRRAPRSGARVRLLQRGEGSAARGASPPAVARRLARRRLPEAPRSPAPSHPARQAAAPVAHRASRALRPAPASAAVLDRLPAIVPQVFIAKMQEWLTGAFSEFAKTQAAEVPRRLGGSGGRRHADVHDRASARPQGDRCTCWHRRTERPPAWPTASRKGHRRRSASTRSRDTSVTDPVHGDPRANRAAGRSLVARRLPSRARRPRGAGSLEPSRAVPRTCRSADTCRGSSIACAAPRTC